MINIQISDGSRSGVVTFLGDEALEPCNFEVSGDFNVRSIINLFWIITATAEGSAQGIYPIDCALCAPYEMLRVFALTAVTATGVPDTWYEEMEADMFQSEDEFSNGAVS